MDGFKWQAVEKRPLNDGAFAAINIGSMNSFWLGCAPSTFVVSVSLWLTCPQRLGHLFR